MRRMERSPGQDLKPVTQEPQSSRNVLEQAVRPKGGNAPASHCSQSDPQSRKAEFVSRVELRGCRGRPDLTRNNLSFVWFDFHEDLKNLIVCFSGQLCVHVFRETVGRRERRGKSEEGRREGADKEGCKRDRDRERQRPPSPVPPSFSPRPSPQFIYHVFFVSCKCL